MKATAVAHPIQGVVKYHGMRDHERRYPYHDSISVCTAPSRTTTTVEWLPDASRDQYVIDGEPVEGRAAERIAAVVEETRRRAETDDAVRVESANSFRSNVGLGSSASGFAALAYALCTARGMGLSRPTISTIARRGSASAARAVTGGFSDLHAGVNDDDCRSHRLEPGTGELDGESFDLESDLRIVAALVPAYKETEDAHREAADSHMFDARRTHVQDQLQRARDAIRRGSFHDTFEIAEHDSLSLAAATMTGPSGWVYWKPETLAVFEAVRELRDEGVPAYFSTDTGASVYINTTAAHAERVAGVVGDRLADTTTTADAVETNVWEVGGPARETDDNLF